MLKIFVTVLLFLNIVATCRSQQRELDSLLKILKTYSKQDTTRIQLLNDIAFDYSRIDPAKGLNAAEEAIRLSEKLHNDNKLASAYSYKAMNLSGLGEDSLSLEFYKRALIIHQRLGNNLRVATTCNNIAIALVNLSDYPQAAVYHEKAFKIFEMLNDSIRMGNSLNNRGVIFLYLSDYRKALDLHFRALKIFEHLQNKQVTATTLINIGLVYNHLSNFEKALTYQQDAYKIYEASGDKQGMINALGNIGNVYHDMDKNAEALSYYQRALSLSQETGDKRGIASNTSNMGIVYSGIGNYTAALNHFERSLKINRQSGDKKRIAGDLYEIGKIYLVAPDSVLIKNGISNRFNEIYDHELQSLRFAEEIGSADIQREAWYILSKAYEKQHLPEKALNAYKNYITLRDSIINTEVKVDIQKKEMEFEFEKKEIVLRTNQQKQHTEALAIINRQKIIKNSAIAVAAVILVAALTSFIFYKRKRDARDKQHEAELKLKAAETEMDVLQLQMNPHFIFNSLNSINHYIDNNEKDKATLFTTKFSKLMRLTLENSRKKEITLADDIHLLDLYLGFERLRLRESFSYEIKLGSEINPENTFVPPMILQPFVENSIWHGLSGKHTGGKICIEVVKKDNMIIYTVEDNGVGINKDKKAEIGKTSMGIKITNDRINMLNELKKSNAGIRLIDMHEGLRVEISLPLEIYS